MSAEQKLLDVKILNTSKNRQAVEDLVKSFNDAGKLSGINQGPIFMRYEALGPLTAADSITDADLSALRGLGASANIRTVLAPR